MDLKRQFLKARGLFLHAAACIFFFHGSLAQQCTLPSKIFLPRTDTTKYLGIGGALDVDGDYMVVGAAANDSLEVNSGLAYVYKLNTRNQWVRVAKLYPSDPGKFVMFGSAVSIESNSIAIYGVELNGDGERMGKIYIYEKPSAGEWTSTSESYVIKNSTGFTVSSFGEFDLHGDELVAVAYTNSQMLLRVYQKNSGVYSLTQSFNAPSAGPPGSFFTWKLAVGDSFFAIGSNQYINGDGSYGAVFVYEKNGTYKTSPAKLTSSVQTAANWQGFGTGIAASQSTLFVAGLIQHVYPDYDQTYYVIEQPLSGWADAQQAPVFETKGSVSYNFDFAANADYFFITAPDFNSVRGFKKPTSGWASLASSFTVGGLAPNKNYVGGTIDITDNHLVLGCPAKILFQGINKEFIADYYSPTRTWDDLSLQVNQLVSEITVNASRDLFGVSMDANNDFLAVGASQDSKVGIEAGAVYLYKIADSNGAPEIIYPPENQNYMLFGQSVALGDSVMFVAACLADSISADNKILMSEIGKVYVYRLGANGWKYHSRIIAPSLTTTGAFGQSVSYFRGYVAIAEYIATATDNGAKVHLYKEDSNGKFNYLATLKPSIDQRYNFFGRSVIINDSLIVVASGNFAVDSEYRMHVYIFKKKGEWKNATEDAMLSASDSYFGDRFGFSIAMQGDNIVAGAPGMGYLFGHQSPGAAYIFKRPSGGWKGNIFESAKLNPSDPVNFGNFGYSVAIDHNDIFVGSPYAVDWYDGAPEFFANGTVKPGKVYHYKKPIVGDWTSTSTEDRQLTSFEPEPLDGYGKRIFVSDRYLYVSAMLDDNASGFQAGSVQTMMQLPVIDSVMPLCNTSPPVKVKAFPSRGGQWTGDGINSTNRTFNPSVAGVGIHTLNYLVSGCQASTSVDVILDDFNVFAESPIDQTKCFYNSILLWYNSNEDAANYYWYYKDKVTSAYVKIDSLKKQIVAAKPGYYEVKVSRAICPARREDFTVADEAIVTIKIDSVNVICSDAKQNLSSSPNAGTWTGQGVSPNGVFDPISLPDGNYKERYDFVTALGCQYKDSINIKVDKLKEPIMIFNHDKICGSTPVTLALGNVDDRSKVEWLDGSQRPIKDAASATLPVFAPGNYAAIVSKFDCSFHVPEVTVEMERDSLFVPNVFTPNGDSHNDFFEIRSEGLTAMDLNVFNRYGNLVYQTNDLGFRWPANEVSPGVYFWRITYATCSAGSKEQKGWVQVIK